MAGVYPVWQNMLSPPPKIYNYDIECLDVELDIFQAFEDIKHITYEGPLPSSPVWRGSFCSTCVQLTDLMRTSRTTRNACFSQGSFILTLVLDEYTIITITDEWSCLFNCYYFFADQQKHAQNESESWAGAPLLYWFAKGGLIRMVAQVAYIQLIVSSSQTAHKRSCILHSFLPSSTGGSRGKRKQSGYQARGRSFNMIVSVSPDSDIQSNSATLLWTLYEY